MGEPFGAAQEQARPRCLAERPAATAPQPAGAQPLTAPTHRSGCRTGRRAAGRGWGRAPPRPPRRGCTASRARRPTTAAATAAATARGWRRRGQPRRGGGRAPGWCRARAMWGRTSHLGCESWRQGWSECGQGTHAAAVGGGPRLSPVPLPPAWQALWCPPTDDEEALGAVGRRREAVVGAGQVILTHRAAAAGCSCRQRRPGAAAQVEHERLSSHAALEGSNNGAAVKPVRGPGQ
jgi:hypothetical protein